MRTKFTFERVAFSALVIVAASILAVFLYQVRQEDNLKVTPVDVLKDRSIKVDDTNAYKVGDTVAVTTTFTKVVDIAPKKSTRYIQCVKPERVNELVEMYDGGERNFQPSDWDGKVPINEGQSSANKGRGSSTLNLVIPFNIGFVPNICRVNLNSVYDVNKYHLDFPENGYSNPFKVGARPGISAVDSNTTYVYTDESTPNSGPAMINIVPQAGERVIIYQNPPAEEASPQQQAPPQGPVRSVVNGVTDFLRGVF